MNLRIGLTLLVLVALASAAAPPAVAKEPPPRDPAVAAALERLAEGGVPALLRFEKPDPVRELEILNAVARHLYWQARDLPLVVRVSRMAIDMGVAAADGEEDAGRAAAIRGQVKALAYNLASFTWPGWAKEGIEVRQEDREAGLAAAKRCVALAAELGQGPQALSNARWVLGAQLLAAGEHAAAIEAFEVAREKADAAENPLGALMCEGYAGLALVLSGGDAAAGERRFRKAVAALRDEGSDDARFYAEQLWTALGAFGGRVRPEERSWRLACGPLSLEVVVSRTAHLYHVVDRLAGRDDTDLAPWLARFPLSPRDRLALDRFATIRERKAAGELEATFLTADDLDGALFAGAAEGHLAPDEVESLRAVFTRFADRADDLLLARRGAVGDLVGDGDRERLASAAGELGALCGVSKLTLRVFPVVGPEGDLRAALRREVARAFFAGRAAEIAATAESTPGLDAATLLSALVTAYCDGLRSGAGGDPLAARAAGHLKAGEGLGDPAAGADLLALAIRPLLREALGGGELADLLPRVRDAWLVLGATRGLFK